MRKGVVKWMIEQKKNSKNSRRLKAFFLSSLLCAASLWRLGGGAQAARLEAETLIPVGHTIGIKLFSQGVVVVGLSEVQTGTEVKTPGVDCGLRVGDVIETAGGVAVESTEQFAQLLQGGGQICLELRRDGRQMTATACPVLAPDGLYHLGAWIRDSMAGIGTVTFYDPDTGTFGALGHGITDSDTGMLMPMGNGAVMDAQVKAVKKGSAGEPGELRGSFDLTEDMGELYANTDRGVFGTMDSCDFLASDAIPVARPGQVRTGPAVILSNVAGDEVEAYTVEITRIMDQTDTQNLLLRVTDDRLIAQTGGIVQGMSGSPILQDGRLVGAVTHVMVNDPEKGYGILIENMLATAAR